MTELALAHDLLELAKKYDAGKAWDKAFADTIEHILLVAENNPNKDLKAILARPDMQEAVTEPFVAAGIETLEAVHQAWTAEGQADLDRVVKNVHANLKSAPDRIRKAMLGGPRDEMAVRLKKLAKDMQLRAQYAVDYAQKRSATVKLLEEAGPKAQKTWAAKDPQCSACKALVGTTIKVSATFSLTAGGLKLGSFGPLIGPPRHPNCKCYLEIT